MEAPLLNGWHRVRDPGYLPLFQNRREFQMLDPGETIEGRNTVRGLNRLWAWAHPNTTSMGVQCWGHGDSDLWSGPQANAGTVVQPEDPDQCLILHQWPNKSALSGLRVLWELRINWHSSSIIQGCSRHKGFQLRSVVSSWGHLKMCKYVSGQPIDL